MKTKVILAIVFLLALCQAGYAADLQAGWYANIDPVYVFTYDPVYHNPTLMGEASFLTPPGQYGPFTVTNGPYQTDFTRYISVSANAYGATSDQSLILPLYMAWAGDQTIAYISLAGETNYDSSVMCLELWHQDTDGLQRLVWSQSGSGLQYIFGPEVEQNTLFTGQYCFELAIVPEPTSLASLTLGLAALVSVWRRKR